MTARVTSDLFASAWIRRFNLAGGFAVLRRRGAEQAGAIFVKVDRLDGTAVLYGPAPQTEVADDAIDRMFIVLSKPGMSPLDIEERLTRELRYDPDIWILEADDREGRHFLDVVEPKPE